MGRADFGGGGSCAVDSLGFYDFLFLRKNQEGFILLIIFKIGRGVYPLSILPAGQYKEK